MAIFQEFNFSCFINAWPTRSYAIQNAAGFHKIFKPSFNAVSVRRVLSKLIFKFKLYCRWRFQFMVPKNILCFLLNVVECCKLTPLLKMTYLAYFNNKITCKK